MYKLCKSEQSAARQRTLELGLLDMMQSVPFEQISITDFCDRMNIPRKAFYRYFSDKESALYALIDHTLMEYENFPPITKKGKRTILTDLEQFLLFWKEQKMLLDALQRSNLMPLLASRTMEYAVHFGGISARFLADAQDELLPYQMEFALTGMLSMVIKWHSGGFREPAAQLAAILARLLTKPLFTTGDPLF